MPAINHKRHWVPCPRLRGHARRTTLTGAWHPISLLVNCSVTQPRGTPQAVLFQPFGPLPGHRCALPQPPTSDNREVVYRSPLSGDMTNTMRKSSRGISQGGRGPSDRRRFNMLRLGVHNADVSWLGTVNGVRYGQSPASVIAWWGVCARRWLLPAKISGAATGLSGGANQRDTSPALLVVTSCSKRVRFLRGISREHISTGDLIDCEYLLL